MSAYTPGPWTAHDSDGRVDIYAGSELVCRVEGGNARTDTANAKLIAAAPTMFDALRLLRTDRCADCGKYHGQSFPTACNNEFHDADELADAALAKAAL